jgi:DNA-binding response OmpR family regulator
MPSTMPVLIVEDDPMIRDVLAEALTDEGYRTLTALHGAEALSCLERVRPCLILLDLMMPVLDGFGFREIQRSRPQFASIPVVILSAFPANVETVATLDAAAYLSKPIDLDRLVATVERYCL